MRPLAGEFIEWAIADNRYWPSNERTIIGFVYPSRKSGAIEKPAREMMRKVGEKLKKRGFNNCFCMIEFFLFSDGTVKVSYDRPFYHNYYRMSSTASVK